MTLQAHQHQNPTARDLREYCIYLPQDGPLRSFAKTAEFLRNSGKSPELMDGCMLALYCVNEPRDVHFPDWEMHPAGDELLLLTSGALSVDVREGAMVRTAPLPSQSAFIVPAGVWHRLIVHEPSVLIAMTPRRNTVHEKG